MSGLCCAIAICELQVNCVCGDMLTVIYIYYVRIRAGMCLKIDVGKSSMVLSNLTIIKLCTGSY
jgi:hypothetical protein